MDSTKVDSARNAPGIHRAYLCRDGRAVDQFHGASTADAINKALHALHKLTAVSWSHALKYEGWSIEAIDGRRLA